MLKVAAFTISDDEGINKLLSEFRLAAGAGILVSEGKVLIPYEDGAVPTASQRIAQIREDQNKLQVQRDLIEHSQRVLDHMIADEENRVNVARAKMEEATDNPTRKEHEAKLRTAENKVEQLQNQKLMNEHEINRLDVNIEEYEATITATAINA